MNDSTCVECAICLKVPDVWRRGWVCKHTVCHICYPSVRDKSCPLCRSERIIAFAGAYYKTPTGGFAFRFKIK